MGTKGSATAEPFAIGGYPRPQTSLLQDGQMQNWRLRFATINVFRNSLVLTHHFLTTFSAYYQAPGDEQVFLIRLAALKSMFD